MPPGPKFVHFFWEHQKTNKVPSFPMGMLSTALTWQTPLTCAFRENSYIESFNGNMRDELLAKEIFYNLKEAQVLIEVWRKNYNIIRPHSALGYRRPAPAAIYVQPT